MYVDGEDREREWAVTVGMGIVALGKGRRRYNRGVGV